MSQDRLIRAQGQVAFGSDLAGDDFAGNRWLHGAVLRCPHGHAELVGLDDNAARAAPGVVAVLDCRHSVAPIPGEIFYDKPFSARPLWQPVCRHAGAAVALVLAQARRQSAEALRLLRPQWRVLPANTDLGAAAAEGRELLPFGPIRWQRGDVDAAFADAERQVEHWFATSTVQAGALEPYVCAVEPRQGGGVVVHKGVPAPFELRRQLAHWMGLAEAQVEIRCPPTGGGFGSRMDDLEYLAALGCLHSGRGVRLQLDRGDGWLAGRVRHGARMRVRSALGSGNRLIARDLEVWYDCGAYADLGPFVVLRALRPLVLYGGPNVRFAGHLLATNKPIAGATRGFGNPQATFAVEAHNDMLCRQFGIDRVQFRRANAVRSGDHNFSVGAVNTDSGEFGAKPAKVGSCELQACIDWAQARGEHVLARLPSPPSGWRRGTGMACAMHTSGKGRAELSTAEVTWRADGAVLVRSGAVDQGGTGVLAMIRETARLALQRSDSAGIEVVLDSTSSELADSGSHASGRTYVAGAAVHDACLRARERVSAGEKLPVTERIAHQPASNAPPFAAVQCVADVDMQTGEVRVRWLGVGVDAGRILDPDAARGQVLGAAVQGLGFALSERLDFAADGRLASWSVADYGTPRAFEVPDIDVHFADSREPSHPLGCKGVGEIGLMAVAPAVVNAIADAIGRPVLQLPASPEVVWRALQES